MVDVTVPVSEGTRVYLNFSVSLEDGSEVDSNFGGEPVDFAIGDGSLLPGFERLLFGMSAGERQMFRGPPEDAFGQPNDNNVQYLPRDRFDAWLHGLWKEVAFDFRGELLELYGAVK